MDLQYALDHLAILNRYSAYTYAVDQADVTAFLDCFTADAEMDISSFKVAWANAGDALRKFADANGVVKGAGQLAKSVGAVNLHHLTANILVRSIEGNRARGSAYFVVFSPDEGKVEHYGRYEDELLKCEDGQWRISKRHDVALYERDHHTPVN
jgi:SnoaL-like domain